MTRSVYTLCVFQNLNPVGFCVVCGVCGELQAKEMLSEEWKVKSEKSNGLSEDTQATSVEQSPTKPHVLFLLNQAFTLPLVLMFSCLNI